MVPRRLVERHAGKRARRGSRRSGRRALHAIVSRSSVGTARTLPFPSGSSRFRTTSTPSTLPLTENGDRRDAEAQPDRPRLARRRRAANPRRISTFRWTMFGAPRAPPRSQDRARARPGRRQRPRPPARPAPAAPSASRPPAPARGGRGRRSRGSRTPLIASIAASVVSVGASSSRRQRQHARDVERDVPVPDDDGALSARGRTRAPGSPDGRCTRRRARSRPTSREGPRPGSRGAGRSARRRA